MNNNKKTITICSIAALIILAIVVVVTLISDLTGFSIVFGAFFVVLTVCLAIYLREEPDEFNAFIKNKKRILRTYDSVIIEVEDIPNIAGKNIIKVKSIEDLVDAQLELREPIYYKNDNDSCFFILLHYNEACIFVLRMNDSVVSPTEQSIRYMKEEKTDKTKEQENILENLEKTVVYKLDELRSFRISPIRNNEKINVVDDTAIKKEIEASKEQEITSSALSSELSKTMYLKDLRERMLKYEEEQSKTKELLKTNEDDEEETTSVVTEEIEEESSNEDVSAIERLRKMVKEQEQEITKEINLESAREEVEESTLEEEPVKEEVIEEPQEDPRAILLKRVQEKKKEEIKEEIVEEVVREPIKEVIREVKTDVITKVEPVTLDDEISTPKKEEVKPEVVREEKEIKIQVVEDTAKRSLETSKKDDNSASKGYVRRLLIDDDEPEDDEYDADMNGVIVLHSLEEEPEVKESIFKTQEFVPVTIKDEEEEETPFSSIKVVEESSSPKLEINELKTYTTLSDDDLDYEEDEDSSERSLLQSIVDKQKDEDEVQSFTTVDEDDDEMMVLGKELDEEDNVLDSEDIDESDETEEKVTKVTKPRRNTKPRKVTHSARRAQKHVSRTKR